MRPSSTPCSSSDRSPTQACSSKPSDERYADTRERPTSSSTTTSTPTFPSSKPSTPAAAWPTGRWDSSADQRSIADCNRLQRADRNVHEVLGDEVFFDGLFEDRLHQPAGVGLLGRRVPHAGVPTANLLWCDRRDRCVAESRQDRQTKQLLVQLDGRRPQRALRRPPQSVRGAGSDSVGYGRGHPAIRAMGSESAG